jgi:hypothetical protein
MTTPTTATTVAPYPIHFLGCLTIVTSESGGGQGAVTEYGNELIVTSEFHNLNRDRNGDSFLDLLDDEPAQMKRWGRVLVERGPWPEDLSRVEPGSQRWHDEAEAARVEAFKISDLGLRHQRQSEINAKYGPRPTTSTTIASYGRQASDPAPEASR